MLAAFFTDDSPVGNVLGRCQCHIRGMPTQAAVPEVLKAGEPVTSVGSNDIFGLAVFKDRERDRLRNPPTRVV